MISSVTRNHIAHALNSDQARQLFDQRIDQLATAQGSGLSAEDMEGLARLARRYVNETISLLDACSVAAEQAQAEPLVEPVCETAVRIFDAQDDELAAKAGLFGMLCDAYIARTLIARMSQSLRLTRGVPLLSADPHPEAAIIRSILGRRLADELEDVAADLQDTPRLRSAMQSAYVLQNPLRANLGDGDWGGSCADDMARLCALAGLRVG